MIRDTSINVRVKSDIKEKLEERAKEEGITLTRFIREKLEEAIEPKKDKKDNKYAFLDDGCILRDYLEEEEAPLGTKFGEGFYCLKKAPTLTRLGSGIESAASKICTKCKVREEALEDSKVLKAQRLKGIEIRMPICTKGGTPSEDLTSMWCPEIGRFRPIDEKKKANDFTPCKVGGKNNSNCPSLKRKTIITGKQQVKDIRDSSR